MSHSSGSGLAPPITQVNAHLYIGNHYWKSIVKPVKGGILPVEVKVDWFQLRNTTGLGSFTFIFHFYQNEGGGDVLYRLTEIKS